MHRQEPGAKIFDVTVDHYKTIQGKEDGSMVVSGTEVVIDSVEANDPRSATRLQARTFTIFPVKDKPRLTERIEAEGNFRFSGSRPTVDGKGIRTFKGNGSKGIYYKQEGRIVFEGPVAFSGHQPTPDSKGSQTLDGTAASAVYNEKTGKLVAQDFKADFTDPGYEGANHFVGDTLDMDLNKRPYVFTITNRDESHGHINLKPKQPEKKPDEKKTQKKPQ